MRAAVLRATAGSGAMLLLGAMGAGAGQGAAIALRETGGRHGEATPHAVNGVGDTDSKDDDDEEELHFRKERSGGKRG